MFNIANTTEKIRIASFDCRQEVVVDMFAGTNKFRIFHNKLCSYTSEMFQASDIIHFPTLCTRVQNMCTQSTGIRTQLKHCIEM
jgi:hypothetical protein